MPFRSKKQMEWMKINKPAMYRKWKKEHGLGIYPKKKKTKKGK